MKKSVQVIYLLLGLVLLFNSVLTAGTTGKISGTILDQDTGQPLIGANVFVEGTVFGAATNLDGFYNILNLTPGLYTLRISMMGYTPMIVNSVRSSIDQTTTINGSLSPTVLETGEAVTITAPKLLVKTDMTSSFASVSSDEIDDLPVQSMTDVLELQAGIVRSGNDLHIRGGRSGEIAFWVDGVASTDVFSGNMGVSVENSAIQELQVVSGTFNAEYGQAMSGIVNIITKEGSDKYSGEFSSYIGDFVSNSKIYNVLDEVQTVVDPVTGNISAVGVESNPLKGFNPIYNSEFNLSGPVPFIGDKVTFFTNGRYQSRQGPLYGRDWYTPQGNPGTGDLVPLNPYEKLSLQGKLTYRFSANLKFSYNYFYNTWQSDRSGDVQNYKYTPTGMPQQGGGGATHLFSWNHVLSPSTFYEARISRFFNEYERYVYEDWSATPRYQVVVYPDTSVGFEGWIIDDYTTPEGQDSLNYVITQRLNYMYRPDPDGPDGYVHPDSSGSPPSSYSYYSSGMDMSHYYRSSAFWLGKLDLTSQMHPAHQVKAGFEMRFHELTLDQFTIRPAADEYGSPIKPFEPSHPEEGSIYWNLYNRKPHEFSAYVQDKIELKELNINIGVRFDYFDANAYKPSDPHDPNIYYPMNDENRYKNWVDPPDTLTTQEREAYYAQFDEYESSDRREFMQEKVDPKMAFSPRLGIAYPISDKGVIHFSYGHFFQVPNFEYLYDNPDFKFSSGGGNQVFGNPNLNPERTVQYEVGLQQQIAENIGVDVTLFYKDIRDWVGTSPLIQIGNRVDLKYSQFENRDYANVRGITLKVEKRYANNFSAGVDYSFQIAEGTYSNPRDAFNAVENDQEPVKNLIPLNWDQNHTLNARFIYRLEDWTFSLIGNYWTGRPYTPSFGVGQFVGGSTQLGLKENSARLPVQKSMDLYINRRFSVAGLHCDIFLNVYNIFNNLDETAVYGDTGTARYTTQINPDKILYNPDRIGTPESLVNRADWHTWPRQIQAGLAIGF
ncbi:TonB-dependent receptor [candidate division KSB1 bacterium]|nr:TonB-dependent receptor [candidate division KSB1 bacterium]